MRQTLLTEHYAMGNNRLPSLPGVESGSYADIRNGLRTPGNCVYVKAYREFESHPIR